MFGIGRAVCAVVSVLVVAACGGGGGGDGGSSSAAFRDPPPALSQDTAPSGARLDLRSRNYFPMATGDVWNYDVTQGSTTTPNGLTRNVAFGPDADGNIVLNEVGLGQSGSTSYRKTAQGIVVVDPLAGVAPPSVRQFVGDLLEIAEPFYAAGSVLESIRQGSWDTDLDGDGHPEGFRLECRRELIGFDTLSLPRGTAEAVHLRTVIVFTLYPSSPNRRDVSSTATEDTWWAPNIGLVRAERRIDGDGGTAPITLTITGGTVGAQPLFAAPPDGTLTKLSLVHNDVVFDPTRQVYYASVPGSAVGVGNSIATIDPTSGAVAYSAVVGSEPFALGLSADGTSTWA
jgi:hypothetical protein